MKRSRELSPLSREHHVALGHALRLRRATPEDVTVVVASFLAFLLGPGRSHFAAEEEWLAPEVPAEHAELGLRMLGDHDEIQRRAARLGLDPEVGDAHRLGELLSRHVRFEERELFPVMEACLPPERLRAIGRRLDSDG